MSKAVKKEEVISSQKEYFYQTKQIIYPDQTPSGTLYTDIVLNNAYERCIGVAIYPIQEGGQSFYRVGLGDQNQDYLNNIHYKALVASEASGLETDKRFMKLNIKAEGHTVKVRTEIPSQVVGTLSYDVVFLLEREKRIS